jgi:hypothetical protein
MRCYVAKKPGEPGAIAMCFDHGDGEAEQWVRAESRRKGVIVEQTTEEEALRLLSERLHWRRDG